MYINPYSLPSVLMPYYLVINFGNYTMESIFAVYLGYKKDLQKGETDELLHLEHSTPPCTEVTFYWD